MQVPQFMRPPRVRKPRGRPFGEAPSSAIRPGAILAPFLLSSLLIVAPQPARAADAAQPAQAADAPLSGLIGLGYQKIIAIRTFFTVNDTVARRCSPSVAADYQNWRDASAAGLASLGRLEAAYRAQAGRGERGRVLAKSFDDFDAQIMERVRYTAESMGSDAKQVADGCARWGAVFAGRDSQAKQYIDQELASLANAEPALLAALAAP